MVMGSIFQDIHLRITIISADCFGKGSLQISTPQFGASNCFLDEHEQPQQDATLAPVQNIIEDKIKFSPNGGEHSSGALAATAAALS